MPRNPGLWDGIPLGFSDGASAWRCDEIELRSGANNPKEIVATSPRLAQRLPWVNVTNWNNLNEVVAVCARMKTEATRTEEISSADSRMRCFAETGLPDL